ncbi:MAG: response regulator [Bacteroidetes bacterium]|nr:response regulator [Bacteroidota bacterium]
MENSDTNKPKIIYVEDQESIARLVNFKLSKDGFDTPGQGWNVSIRGVKSSDEVKNIPVIMLSVHGEDQKVLQAFNSGTVDYIQKPFSTAELTTRIRKALA